MTSYQKKLQIIDTREPFSLKFKSILCFQSNSKYISPILQIFNSPENISQSKGNQSLRFYKMYFLGD